MWQTSFQYLVLYIANSCVWICSQDWNTGFSKNDGFFVGVLFKSFYKRLIVLAEILLSGTNKWHDPNSHKTTCVCLFNHCRYIDRPPVFFFTFSAVAELWSKGSGFNMINSELDNWTWFFLFWDPCCFISWVIHWKLQKKYRLCEMMNIIDGCWNNLDMCVYVDG